MKPSFLQIEPFAEAISKLLHPLAEVVMHDLASDTIVAIYNPLSRREAGDPSYLEKVDFDQSGSVIGPYDKTNWDGRPMKSISVVVRNSEGEPDGFLCINVDTSAFRSAQALLQGFLGNNEVSEEESEQLFQDDLYERFNLFVQSYCRKRQVTLEGLNRKEKQELVVALVAEGAFKEKNAATYLGRILGVSRATIYNYLKKEES